MRQTALSPQLEPRAQALGILLGLVGLIGLLGAACGPSGSPPTPSPEASGAAETAQGAGSAGSAVAAGAAQELPAPGPEMTAKVDALVARLDIPAERNAARKEILALGKDATPALLQHAEDESFTIRWEMVNVQGDLQDERAIPTVTDRVLRDENPHVRWRGTWALRSMPDASLPLELLREGLASGDEGQRWNAAVALSVFGIAEGLPILQAGLDEPDRWRQWEAVNALGRVHDASSARALEPLLSSAPVRVRQEAALSLGKIGGPDAVEILIRALTDEEAAVRWRACMALGQSGGESARTALLELKTREEDEMVLKHVGKALTRLDARRGRGS